MESFSISAGLLGGLIVAFAAAVAAIGIDLQDAVKAQLGELANTSVLKVPQGWVVLIAWGLFDAGLYLAIISHPAWASNTFGFSVSDNALSAGLAVGISAVFLIRSKLAKVGTVEVGGEYAYLWSRAYVLASVNSVRTQKRMLALRRYDPITIDLASYPTLFSDLESWLRQLAPGMPSASPKIVAQIDEIKRQTSGAPDRDANARKYLIGLTIDFMGPANLDKFAAASGIKIPGV